MSAAANAAHSTSWVNDQACSETYHDVEKLLHDVVWKFQRKYGGSHDELMAEANYQFMERYRGAYGGQREEYGVKWTTWLRQKVWFHLLDYQDKKIRHGQRLQPCSETKLANLPGRGTFDWERFLGELSCDAQVVLQIGVEDPIPDVVEAAKGGYSTGNGKKITQALYEVLLDMGWDETRILRAFAEIKGALE